MVIPERCIKRFYTILIFKVLICSSILISSSALIPITPQPGDPDFVGPIRGPIDPPQPGDPDFVGPIILDGGL